MVELIKEDLKKYTTVRIGGTAKRMLIPESTDELLKIIKEESPTFFIGGGSNLLISDDEFDLVVNLNSFDDTIKNLQHRSSQFNVYMKRLNLCS